MDQEMLMKTQVLKDSTDEESQSIEIVERKSISQRCLTNFPFFANNVGQQKIIIKSTLKGGLTYVYELPKTERFVNFVEFNKFEDLGFYPGKLRIEMCTNIVFLSQSSTDD
jgi:hypothetical protein